MKTTALTMALAAAGVTAGNLPAMAQVTTTGLTLASSKEHGAYLADGDGRALYLFEADTQGRGDQEAVSTCYDACAEAWPPLIVEAAPEAGDQIQANFVATTERNDGKTQVTYNGWPVYYYVKDQGPGQTTGHDIEDFGAEWYLLTAKGEKVGER